MEQNWRVLGGEGVLVEPEAVDQLQRVAGTPGCVRAVGLPDIHPGPGLPIGAAVATTDVRPALVGSDAGCGVRLVVHERIKAKGDVLMRRVLEATEEPCRWEVAPEELLGKLWQEGPAGLAGCEGLPEDLRELAAREPPLPALPHPVPESFLYCADALGTIGGGNHFLELSQVQSVVDPQAADRLGLERGRFVVVVHSGSRGLGRMLADRWPDAAGEPERYLAELEGAVRFARANRLVLGFVLSRAVGVPRVDRVVASLDVVHNTVVSSGGVFVHRKGAAPADKDELTVVLGSRGAPSWVLCGTGADHSLCSVAHGAGRRIARADARGRIRARYKRTELTRTSVGSRVICDDQDLLYEEHPDCYKPIDPVIEALVAHGVAHKVASLLPVLTVKR
jgi:release factor H-coupled RctB family protein